MGLVQGRIPRLDLRVLAWFFGRIFKVLSAGICQGIGNNGIPRVASRFNPA
jgi:hypothetical protein